MRDKLSAYVRNLFRDAADTPRNRDLEEEILQNTLDRYDDLVKSGSSPDSAYTQAIANLGNVSSLLETLPRAAEKQKSSSSRAALIATAIVISVILLVVIGIWMLYHNLRVSYVGKENFEIGMSFDDRVEEWAEGVEQKVEIAVDEALGNGTPEFDYHYIDADRFTAGSAEIETRNVNRIVIDWVSGNVTVEPYDGDTISISEPEQKEEAYRLHWRQEGNTLTVRFCASMNTLVSDGKDLVVRVPAELAGNLRYLQIDTVSADVFVSGVKAGELQADTSSGSIHAEGTFGIVDADTVSGNLELIGTGKELDLDTTSGDFGVTLSETPDELSFDSTSGDLTLMLPAKRGFEVEYDTVSGDFKCDFALKGKDDPCYEGTEHGKQAELEFDTVSGDIWIMNARQA